MATITRFEDLEIWQRSKVLCQKIYEFIHRDNFSKDYKLVNQINGSSGSVMDNIAEGFGRGSRNEFVQFLGFSKGSVSEVMSQLYRAFDRKYISEFEFKDTYDIADEVSRKINKLISYLNTSEYKGEKYRNRVGEPKEDYGKISLEFEV